MPGAIRLISEHVGYDGAELALHRIKCAFCGAERNFERVVACTRFGSEVTVEQVVRELKLLGFSDIRKVVSWRNELVTRTEKGKDGEPVMVLMPRVTIVDADKISDEAAAAVAEVSQTVNGALRVKLHDKHAALVSIGRYLGMFDDKVKVDAVYGIRAMGESW